MLQEGWVRLARLGREITRRTVSELMAVARDKGINSGCNTRESNTSLSGREYERENTRCPSGSMAGDRGEQVGLSIAHESARDETTRLDSEAASGRLLW